MKPATAIAIVLVLVGIVGIFAGIFIFAIGGQPTGIRLAAPMIGVVALIVGVVLLFAAKRRK